MDAEAIVKRLTELDPVYGPIFSQDKEGKRISIRKCALCRAEGHHNEENVLHEHNCPWIAARKLKKET